MSRSPSDADQAVVEPELSEIAAELYGLRPDEFIAARDERVRDARAEGKRALARELSRLRRPTQSAWLVNVLWRDRREAVEELLNLAADLGQAQQRSAGRDLHDLTTRRRQLEGMLLNRAGELAEAAGVRASAETLREVQETLAAALSLPDVAADVRSGSVVRPASYAGFGAVSPQDQAASPRAPERPDDRATTGARSERAERRVREARAAAEAAAESLAERRSTAEAAHRHVAELRDRMEELQRELDDLERDAAAAQREAQAELRLSLQAEAEHQRAREELESAERALDTE